MATIEDVINLIGELQRQIEENKAELHAKVDKLNQDLTVAVMGNLNNIANVQTAVQEVKVATDKIGSGVAKLVNDSKSGTGGGSANKPPQTQQPPLSSPASVDLTIGLPTPKFDPTCMTVDSFIVECEDYFALKGVQDSSKHILVGRMFEQDSDLAYWFRTKRSSFSSWADFVAALKSYEGGDANKDDLMQHLFSKRQKLSEAFESFAWEMHSSYRRIDATVTESAIVDRILSSGLPEMSQILRPHNCKTVEDLIKTAKLVVGNLNMIRKFENKTLLRVRKSDPMSTFNNKHASSGWKKPSHNGNESATKADNNAHSSSSSQAKIKCTYTPCGKIGHKIEDCRKKRYDELVGNPTSVSTSSSSTPPGNVTRQ